MGYKVVSNRWTKRQVAMMVKLQGFIGENTAEYDQFSTGYCIWGLFGRMSVDYNANSDPYASDILEFVGNKLKINGQEVSDVYHYDALGWIPKFRRQFRTAKTNRGRAGAAIRMIDHWIETGTVSVSSTWGEN